MGGQSIHQVVLTWACLVLQAGRRLYECLFVQKTVAEGGGRSRMSVAHYALGLVFYVCVCVGGWAEGTGMFFSAGFKRGGGIDGGGPWW